MQQVGCPSRGSRRQLPPAKNSLQHKPLQMTVWQTHSPLTHVSSGVEQQRLAHVSNKYRGQQRPPAHWPLGQQSPPQFSFSAGGQHSRPGRALQQSGRRRFFRESSLRCEHRKPWGQWREHLCERLCRLCRSASIDCAPLSPRPQRAVSAPASKAPSASRRLAPAPSTLARKSNRSPSMARPFLRWSRVAPRRADPSGQGSILHGLCHGAKSVAVRMRPHEQEARSEDSDRRKGPGGEDAYATVAHAVR
jgi:hypothetical protein